MAPVPTSFFDLPGELLLECFKYLDHRTLVRCTQVCKTLRQSIKESLELQYLIELGADGLVEGVGCSLPTSERLKLLLQRRAKWRYLNWTQITPVAAPALCQAYELVDGVFASSMGNDFSGSRHLQLTWLPTTTNEARTIERDDLGVRMRDFAIDPSQDLMALVIADDVASHLVGLSFTILLRTISENKPHPKARVPQLQAPVPFQVGNSFVQIVDDVVGAFFWVHGPGLIIWNWRTSRIAVNCIGFDLPTGAYDFAFISNRAYMITVTTGCGSIELYTFSDADENDIDNASSNSNTPQSPSIGHRLLPTHVATLSLPPTAPGVTLRRFLTHAAPTVANPTPGRLFETERDARVHMMSLFYGDPSRSFYLFLHNRYLLSHVPPGTGTGTGSGGEVKAIERQWDDWGPDNTRFVDWIAHFQWLRYVHGQRVMFPPIPLHEADEGGEMVMLMVDFNVHPRRLDDPVDATGRALGGDAGARYQVVDGETTTDPEAVFRYPVVSRLPYAVTTRKGVRDVSDYTGFMIDQDRLVGMRSGDEGYVDLEVYTF